MDTTAERGIYDPDNKKLGRSNAKEVAEALVSFKEFRGILRPENFHEVSVGLGWAAQEYVRSRRPDLVIIHRSVFYHPQAANLDLPYPEFKTPEEQKKFDRWYKVLGDDELKRFVVWLGKAAPRTRFLVYSRGTDKNWLSEEFRLTWIKDLESQYPVVAGRVTPMLIPNGMTGSFRQAETRDVLRSNVVNILKLANKTP
jgi:hypothetical protein